MRNQIGMREMKIIICLKSILKDMEELAEQGRMSKEEKTATKYISTYVSKYVHACLDRVDIQSIERLLRKLDTYMPAIEAKTNTQHRRLAVLDSDYYYLVELVLNDHCRNCTKETSKTCKIYEAFQEALVPELNLKEEHRPCPYQFCDEDLGIKNDKQRN